MCRQLNIYQRFVQAECYYMIDPRYFTEARLQDLQTHLEALGASPSLTKVIWAKPETLVQLLPSLQMIDPPDERWPSQIKRLTEDRIVWAFKQVKNWRQHESPEMFKRLSHLLNFLDCEKKAVCLIELIGKVDNMLELFSLVEFFIYKDRRVMEQFHSNAGGWQVKLKFYYQICGYLAPQKKNQQQEKKKKQGRNKKEMRASRKQKEKESQNGQDIVGLEDLFGDPQPAQGEKQKEEKLQAVGCEEQKVEGIEEKVEQEPNQIQKEAQKSQVEAEHENSNNQSELEENPVRGLFDDSDDSDDVSDWGGRVRPRKRKVKAPHKVQEWNEEETKEREASFNKWLGGLSDRQRLLYRIKTMKFGLMINSSYDLNKDINKELQCLIEKTMQIRDQECLSELLRIDRKPVNQLRQKLASQNIKSKNETIEYLPEKYHGLMSHQVYEVMITKCSQLREDFSLIHKETLYLKYDVSAIRCDSFAKLNQQIQEKADYDDLQRILEQAIRSSISVYLKSISDIVKHIMEERVVKVPGAKFKQWQILSKQSTQNVLKKCLEWVITVVTACRRHNRVKNDVKKIQATIKIVPDMILSLVKPQFDCNKLAEFVLLEEVAILVHELSCIDVPAESLKDMDSSEGALSELCEGILNQLSKQQTHSKSQECLLFATISYLIKMEKSVEPFNTTRVCQILFKVRTSYLRFHISSFTPQEYLIHTSHFPKMMKQMTNFHPQIYPLWVKALKNFHQSLSVFAPYTQKQKKDGAVLLLMLDQKELVFPGEELAVVQQLYLQRPRMFIEMDIDDSDQRQRIIRKVYPKYNESLNKDLLYLLQLTQKDAELERLVSNAGQLNISHQPKDTYLIQLTEIMGRINLLAQLSTRIRPENYEAIVRLLDRLHVLQQKSKLRALYDLANYERWQVEAFYQLHQHQRFALAKFWQFISDVHNIVCSSIKGVKEGNQFLLILKQHFEKIEEYIDNPCQLIGRLRTLRIVLNFGSQESVGYVSQFYLHNKGCFTRLLCLIGKKYEFFDEDGDFNCGAEELWSLDIDDLVREKDKREQFYKNHFSKNIKGLFRLLLWNAFSPDYWSETVLLNRTIYKTDSTPYWAHCSLVVSFLNQLTALLEPGEDNLKLYQTIIGITLSFEPSEDERPTFTEVPYQLEGPNQPLVILPQSQFMKVYRSACKDISTRIFELRSPDTAFQTFLDTLETLLSRMEKEEQGFKKFIFEKTLPDLSCQLEKPSQSQGKILMSLQWINYALRSTEKQSYHSSLIKFNPLILLNYIHKAFSDLVQEHKNALMECSALLERLIPSESLGLIGEQDQKYINHLVSLVIRTIELKSSTQRIHFNGIVFSMIAKLRRIDSQMFEKTIGQLIKRLYHPNSYADTFCQLVSGHLESVSMELQIKSFFRVVEKQEGKPEIDLNDFTKSFIHKYQDEKRVKFIQIVSSLTSKSKRQIEGNRETCLMLNDSKSYGYCESAKCKFIDVKLPKYLLNILGEYINGIDKKNDDNFCTRIHQLTSIMVQHPLLVSVILAYPVMQEEKQVTFLSYVIKRHEHLSINDKQRVHTMFYAALTNPGPLSDINGELYSCSELLSYQIASVLFQQTNFNYSSLYLLMYLCGFKNMASACLAPLDQHQTTLTSKLWKQLENKDKDGAYEDHKVIQIMTILGMINRQQSIGALEGLYVAKNMKQNSKHFDPVIQSSLVPFYGIAKSKKCTQNTNLKQQIIEKEAQASRHHKKIHQAFQVFFTHVNKGLQTSSKGPLKDEQGDIIVQLSAKPLEEVPKNQIFETKIGVTCVCKQTNLASIQVSFYHQYSGACDKVASLVIDKVHLGSRNTGFRRPRHRRNNNRGLQFLMLREDPNPNCNNNEDSSENEEEERGRSSRYAPEELFHVVKKQSEAPKFEVELQRSLKEIPELQQEKIVDKGDQPSDLTVKQKEKLEDVNQKRHQLGIPLLKAEQLGNLAEEELEIAWLQADFDLRQKTMPAADFESYCLANSHKFEKISPERQNVIMEMEEAMLQRYVRRTTSSDSIDYIIDTIDENYQLLPQRKMSETGNTGNKVKEPLKEAQHIHFQRDELPDNIFLPLSDQQLIEVLRFIYFKWSDQAPQIVVPFLQNVTAQSRIVTALKIMIENPFETSPFPSTLYQHQVNSANWEANEDKNFVGGLASKFIHAVRKYSFYQDKNWILSADSSQIMPSVKLQLKQKEKETKQCSQKEPKEVLQYKEEKTDLQQEKQSRQGKKEQKQTEQSKVESNQSSKVELCEVAKPDPKAKDRSSLDIIFERLQKYSEHLDSDILWLVRGVRQPSEELVEATIKQILKLSSDLNDKQGYYDLDDYVRLSRQYSIADNLNAISQSESFGKRFKKLLSDDLNLHKFLMAGLVDSCLFDKDQIKKLHKQAIEGQNNSSSSLFFIAKAFSLYTDSQLKEMIWIKDKAQNLVRVIQGWPQEKHTSIKKQPIYRVFQHPHLLNFEMKKDLLMKQVNDLSNQNSYNGQSELFCQKKRGIFESAFYDLRNKPDSFWLSGFDMRFIDEEGAIVSGIGGGVTKDWYTYVSKGMVNLDYGIFMRTGKNYCFFNRESWINPRHLQFLEFIGKLFALSIYQEEFYLAPSFSVLIYRFIVGQQPKIEDIIEEFDEGEVIKNVEKLREFTDDSMFCQTFTYQDVQLVSSKSIPDEEKKGNKVEFVQQHMEITSFQELPESTVMTETDLEEEEGSKKIIKVLKVAEEMELKPGGKDIAVTLDNLEEFITLTKKKIYDKIVQEVTQQKNAFLEGFRRVIPQQLLKSFTGEELRRLAEGSTKFTVDQLKPHVRLQGRIRDKTELLDWFWDIVESLSGEDKVLLIQHWTGIPKVPSEGFENYGLVIGPPFSDDQTRVFSQTCFKKIRLPYLKSKVELQSAMRMSIATVKMGVSLIED